VACERRLVRDIAAGVIGDGLRGVVTRRLVLLLALVRWCRALYGTASRQRLNRHARDDVRAMMTCAR
jgi:hypothetical protein